MRIVKPLRLSLVYRTFENAGQPMLTVTGFVGFRLDNAKAIEHEVALWKAVGKTMPDSRLDDFMAKTRGEVVAAGSAFVIGPPQPGTNVRITVNRDDAPKPLVDKELVVFGDRSWTALGMTQPQPFNEMPLSWDRAFGGEGYAENPAGRGYKPIEVDGKKTHPLPNIEYRNRLLTSPGDKPPPASFLPLDVTSPLRMKKTGTYDQKWLETRFPYYPEDFDWEFFNVASPDQRVGDFFTGKETFRIEGMHPEQRVIEGALPPAVARAFIERKATPGELVEVPMHIDTLTFFPSMLIGVVSFRGTVPVDEDDGDDVKTLVGGIDDRDFPREAAHYLHIQRLREDKTEFHAELLDDAPLLPQWFVEPNEIEEGWNDVAEHVQFEHNLRKRGEANRDHELGIVKEKLVAQGFTEEEAAEKLPVIDLTGGDRVPTTLGQIPAAIKRAKEEMDEAKAMLEKRQAEEEKKAREAMAEKGRDFDAERRANLQAAAGPPKKTASEEYQQLERELDQAEARGMDVSERRAELEAVRGRFEELDEMQLSAYRQFGHQMPVPPARLDPDASRERVAEALARHARGESLRRFDFTGIDLAGADLRGADLSQAMFECATFQGAKLSGANLTEAMLGRSCLDGGDFEKVDLTGANLAASTFKGAKLDGANLSKTNWYESNLDGGSFKGSKLETVSFLKTTFGTCDFSGADIHMSSFIESDLTGCKFAGAKSDQLSFIKCKLDRADFSTAQLTRTAFTESSGEIVSFEKARFDRVAFAGEVKFPGAIFKNAFMRHACLRGGYFREADFTEADAEECDFSSADLTGGKLYRMKSPRSLFIRTDLSGADMKSTILMYSLLQKARIYGADFRGSNLFRADLSKVRGDTNTTFEGAYLVQITVAGSLAEEKARALRPAGIR